MTRLAGTIAVLVGGVAVASAQGQIVVPDGPRHFIVLVDSSKSMTRDGARTFATERAKKRLIQALLAKGHALSGLPKFNQAQDLLTVGNYGIDQGQPAWASYKRLSAESVKAEYLQTTLLHARNVHESGLRNALAVKRHTNLGVQAWARSLGLWASRVPAEAAIQRTFLLLITDDEANGGSLSEEAQVLEHFASPSDRQFVSGIRQNVNRKYAFVDKDGLEGPLCEQSFGTKEPVYLSAFEVVPRAAMRQQAAAASMLAVQSAEGRWARETISPLAVVDLSISEEARKWAGQNSKSWILAETHDAKGRSHDKTDVGIGYKNLPWQPQVGHLSLTLERPYRDDWLGTRQLAVRYRTSFVLPQPATRALVRFLPTLLAGLFGAGIVGAVAWAIYQWKAGRHFRLKVPGFSNPILLPSVGQTATPVQEVAPIAPDGVQEAFRVVLPNRLVRAVLYRSATLTLTSANREVSWMGHPEATVPIERLGREAVAVWTEPPVVPTTAGVEIRRGDDAVRAEVKYPQPHRLASEKRRMAKYYVALDLGSDSMAACYDIDGEPHMVPLQYYAPFTMSAEPDLLREGDGSVSKRLRSQAAIRNNQPSPELGPEHLTLDYFDLETATPTVKEYDHSIFELFHPKSAPPDVNAVLPNPKVMFQFGVDDAFPTATTNESPPRGMRLTPEIVIEHLTVQILHNLVLRWGPMARIYEREPQEIEVILTVPNVYSVEHAETLRRKVANALKVGAVSVLSESDAVAYYRRANLPVRVQEAVGVGGRESKPDDPDSGMHFLTIDIGRGTTDVSLVRIDNQEGREKVTIRGRTGRSSGGGELTYIFVEFYEKQLERAFRDYAVELTTGRPPAQIAALRWPDKPPVSFRWLRERRFRSDRDFLSGLQAIGALVESVKRAYGSHQQFSTPPEAQVHIEALAAALVGLVKSDHVDDPEWANVFGVELETLRQRITEALQINKVLTPGLQVDPSGEVQREGQAIGQSAKGVWMSLKASVLRRPLDLDAPQEAITPRGKVTTQDQDLMWLAAQIEQYVRNNVDDLLIEMGHMVGSQEDHAAMQTRDSRRKLETAISCLVEKGNTYVVVGGQASQFQPIKDRLLGLFGKRGLARYVEDYYHIPGSEAKEACCKGAVVFKRSGDEVANPDHLHGSYALVPYARGSDPAATVSTYELNHQGHTRVETTRETGRYLVYAPGMLGETIDDAKVSRLGASLYGRCYDVYYQLDPVAGCRRLRVGDTPIRLQTYGGLKSVVWHKVWPDQLPEDPQI